VTLGERLKGWMPVVVIAAVAAVGSVVAIPLGGWDTVQLQSRVLPEHPIGEAFEGARFTTSIDDVYLTDSNPDGYSTPGVGMTYLIVVATLQNETDTPQIPLGGAELPPFVVPGVFGLGDSLGIDDYAAYLQRDGSFGPTLAPGVPDTVLFAFPVWRTLFQDGDEVRIALTDATPEEADIYEGTRWAGEHLVAEVPVVLRRES
jgi:hypothetical protein